LAARSRAGRPADAAVAQLCAARTKGMRNPQNVQAGARTRVGPILASLGDGRRRAMIPQGMRPVGIGRLGRWLAAVAVLLLHFFSLAGLAEAGLPEAGLAAACLPGAEWHCCTFSPGSLRR